MKPHNGGAFFVCGAHLVLAVTAAAQTPIIARDGWEAFRVEYIGGDASKPKGFIGTLVLTDSTIAVYECVIKPVCTAPKSGLPFKGAALLSIPLRSIKNVASTSAFRGGNADAAVMIGTGGDRSDDRVAISYETATNAEVPVFKTERAQSGALEAKIRFRLKKAGIDIR